MGMFSVECLQGLKSFLKDHNRIVIAMDVFKLPLKGSSNE